MTIGDPTIATTATSITDPDELVITAAEFTFSAFAIRFTISVVVSTLGKFLYFSLTALK
jgi:hypothetical protein